MDAWAKAMVVAVKSEDYAKATGAMLDAYLTASIPFREMVERTMAQALQQFNIAQPRGRYEPGRASGQYRDATRRFRSENQRAPESGGWTFGRWAKTRSEAR
jgi:hypothetical protein